MFNEMYADSQMLLLLTVADLAAAGVLLLSLLRTK